MARLPTSRLSSISLALLLAACGSSRNVSEGGESTHPANFAQPAVHGAAAVADLASCKLCHGAELAGAFGPSCATCHEQAGFASWTTNCTFCHGQKVATFTAADLPKAAPATGAHAKHVNGAFYAKPLACENCHEAVTSLDHVNGDVTIAFGAIGAADGATGTYAAATQTCSNVYCHGGTLEGAAKPVVTWTGGALVCGDCHDLTPSTGGANGHTAHLGAIGATCQQCHRGFGGIDLDNHVSGTSEAVLANGTKFTAFENNCTACHGAL